MKKLLNSELNRKTITEFKDSQKTPIVIILDNIRSMHNIGSVFRTADAFLIEKIYLCGISGTPPHREIHKSALGAENSVAWEYFENTEDCIRNLKQDNYKIYSIEQVKNSISLINFTPLKEIKYALVFGNEMNGVKQEVIDISDACIEIEQFGTKHSFNIAVTTGIVIWDFYTKLK